jgi:hypothetical protein
VGGGTKQQMKKILGIAGIFAYFAVATFATLKYGRTPEKNPLPPGCQNYIDAHCASKLQHLAY